MAKRKNTKCKSKTTKSNITKSSTSDDINTEVITAALGAINQPILLKVCRLCETKNGPFLNIFDSEKVTAKKIDELMPFWVAENDDLPHKICFRCSAKVEELHEFVQKCVGTQESLRKTVGKKGPLAVKTKTRALWEEKLNKSNMSNDDICDALIKKAMESIQDKIPQLFPIDENNKSDHTITNSKDDKVQLENSMGEQSFSNHDNNDHVALKDIKVSNKDLSSSNECQLKNTETLKKQNEFMQNMSALQNMECSNKNQNESINIESKDIESNNHLDNGLSSDKNAVDTTNSKPFDIMDHVTTIKVHGVGVLFQCKICNRNFLKKNVVPSHACAKSGVPKLDLTNMYIPPEPPKVTKVKYINTKLDKDNKKVTNNENQQISEKTSINSTTVTQTVKKKIGPASKIGRLPECSNASREPQEPSNEVMDKPSNITKQISNDPTPAAVLSFPGLPSLNSRYKLVPGPNNVFTLVEDKSNNSESHPVIEKPQCESPEIIDLAHSPVHNKPAKYSKNAKKDNSNSKIACTSVIYPDKKKSVREQHPYPVGLFQTVPHHSGTFTSSTNANKVPFSTPAMKKLSYTVELTENPNKLLISTKSKKTVEEVPKKRIKKIKTNDNDRSKPSFSVVLEDTSHPKDPGFFSFINVDPLLQPSYVLPTDNIIQESQITTSTTVANKDPKGTNKCVDKTKYTCNMCGEKFNREKKLNAHIFSHYDVEEDFDIQQPVVSRKRGWK